MTLRENKSRSTRWQIIAAVTLRSYSSVVYFVITFSYKYCPEDALKLDWPNRNCNGKRYLFKMRSLENDPTVFQRCRGNPKKKIEKKKWNWTKRNFTFYWLFLIFSSVQWRWQFYFLLISAQPAPIEYQRFLSPPGDGSRKTDGRVKVAGPHLKHSKRVRIVISEVTHIISVWECYSKCRGIVGFSSLATSCFTTPCKVISIVTNIRPCSDPASPAFLRLYGGIHHWLHPWQEKKAKCNGCSLSITRLV